MWTLNPETPLFNDQTQEMIFMNARFKYSVSKYLNLKCNYYVVLQQQETFDDKSFDFCSKFVYDNINYNIAWFKNKPTGTCFHASSFLFPTKYLDVIYTFEKKPNKQRSIKLSQLIDTIKGPKIWRGSKVFVRCIFHENDKTPSLCLYNNGRRFCFSCKKSTTYKEALAKKFFQT